MYLIDQEIAREIAREMRIEPRKIREIFQAKTEEEAEALELQLRESITERTGNSQIGRAIAVYSPLYWASNAISSYIQRTSNYNLRAVAPEVLTLEETALLAQIDIRLTDEEVSIMIDELKRQGTEVPEETDDTHEQYIRVFSYSALRRSTQKIRDKKLQNEISEFLKSFLKEETNYPSGKRNNEDEAGVIFEQTGLANLDTESQSQNINSGSTEPLALNPLEPSLNQSNYLKKQVNKYFKGDDVGWIYDAQNEMYKYSSSTMRSIIRTRFLEYSWANIYLRPEIIKKYRKQENLDRRILQTAHDLIAAVFRYRYTQGEFRKELFDLDNKKLQDYFDNIYIDTDFLSKIPEVGWHITKSWNLFLVEFLNSNYSVIRELAYVLFTFDATTQREECNHALENASLAILKENLDIPWLGHLNEMKTRIKMEQAD